MKMTCHLTRSVFDRYDIVSERDLREASEKLSSVHAAVLAGPNSGQSSAVASGTALTLLSKPTEALQKMVGRDGIEPPTPGFSVLCSTN